MTSKFRQLVESPSWSWTPTALAGSMPVRQTDVLIRSPTSDGSTPASASAFAPAIAAASTNVTSSGHHRRSVTPASCSIMPGFIPVRSYVRISRASNSAEVTTTGASTAHTDSTAVSFSR